MEFKKIKDVLRLAYIQNTQSFREALNIYAKTVAVVVPNSSFILEQLNEELMQLKRDNYAYGSCTEALIDLNIYLDYDVLNVIRR